MCVCGCVRLRFGFPSLPLSPHGRIASNNPVVRYNHFPHLQVVNVCKHVSFLLPSLSLSSQVYRPLSRGTLWLSSLNASDNPVVRYNYFSHPQDVDVCINGSRYLRRIVGSDAMRPFRYSTAPPSLL